MDTHTIDITLFNRVEKDFTDKLHLLISRRMDPLLPSTDEMLKVSHE